VLNGFLSTKDVEGAGHDDQRAGVLRRAATHPLDGERSYEGSPASWCLANDKSYELLAAVPRVESRLQASAVWGGLDVGAPAFRPPTRDTCHFVLTTRAWRSLSIPAPLALADNAWDYVHSREMAAVLWA
jgi:hypothetical protein